MTDLSVDDLTKGRPAGLSVDVLAGPRNRLRKEAVIRAVFFVAGMVAAVISVLIVLSLVREAWTFISGAQWFGEDAQVWGQAGWYPRRGFYDLPTLIVASVIVTVVAMLVAGPLGLGSAIYLSEYASRRTRSIMKPVLEILAGVPSVVLGFFALFFISPELVERIGRSAWLVIGYIIIGTYLLMTVFYIRRTLSGGNKVNVTAVVISALLVAGLFLLFWWVNSVAGSCVPDPSNPSACAGDVAFKVKRSGQLAAAAIGVGILTIPLVASVAEDALASVPRELREASAGLGAKKATTTKQVVLPAAVSGIVAAFIIGISRALGETMVVFMAGGAADAAEFTASPFDGGLTMTAGMASLATGTDNVVGEGLTFQSLYFVGLVLFVLTLALNIVAGRFVARVRERY